MSILNQIELKPLDELKATALPLEEVIGIYFLFKDGELQYIGQSINIHQRVRMHTVKFDSYSFIEYDETDIDLLELAYISRYQPPCNGLGTYRRVEKFKNKKQN